jgi:hypothetical protein
VIGCRAGSLTLLRVTQREIRDYVPVAVTDSRAAWMRALIQESTSLESQATALPPKLIGRGKLPSFTFRYMPALEIVVRIETFFIFSSESPSGASFRSGGGSGALVARGLAVEGIVLPRKQRFFESRVFA